LELRNQLDAIFLAGEPALAGPVLGDRRVTLAKFGVRLKGERIVDFENQAIDTQLRQVGQLSGEFLKRGVARIIDDV